MASLKLASETVESTATMRGVTIRHEAAQVLAVVERMRSLFPPASESAERLQATIGRIGAIAEAARTALTPADERAILQGLRAEIVHANALVRTRVGDAP